MGATSDSEFATYSLAEVHEMTRIPLKSIYNYVRDGSLKVVVPNGAKRGWRVTKKELVRFLGIGDSDEKA